MSCSPLREGHRARGPRCLLSPYSVPPGTGCASARAGRSRARHGPRCGCPHALGLCQRAGAAPRLMRRSRPSVLLDAGQCVHARLAGAPGGRSEEGPLSPARPGGPRPSPVPEGSRGRPSAPYARPLGHGGRRCHSPVDRERPRGACSRCTQTRSPAWSRPAAWRSPPARPEPSHAVPLLQGSVRNLLHSPLTAFSAKRAAKNRCSGRFSSLLQFSGYCTPAYGSLPNGPQHSVDRGRSA